MPVWFWGLFLGLLFGDFSPKFWCNFSVVSHWPVAEFTILSFILVLLGLLFWESFYGICYDTIISLIWYTSQNIFCVFLVHFFPTVYHHGETNPKDILYKIVWFLELNTFYSAWNISLSMLVIFAFLKNKFILIHNVPHFFSIIPARHIFRLFLQSLLFTKALNIAWDRVLWLHQKRAFS